MIQSERPYAKFDDVVKRLQHLCRSQLRANNPTLPTERELVTILGASLMTVRKAVNHCIQAGKILRCGRRTTIIPERPLAKAGRILFLSGNGVPALLPGFERLWLKVRSEIALLGGHVDCLVDTPDDLPEKFIQFCNLFDVILFTVLPPGPHYERKLSYLKKRSDEGIVIALSDTYVDDFRHIVALDNDGVGRAAAGYLNEHGCKHALVLGCLENVILYQKRLKGFRETFQGDCQWMYRTIMTLDNFFLYDELEEIARGIKKGIDAIFFASDEWTPLLTHRLFMHGYLPEKIKVITSNGSGECFQCAKPLPCLTRSTGRVTNVAIEMLCALLDSRKVSHGHRLIQPELCIFTHDDIFHQSLDWHCHQFGLV